ncbi:alpha/beta hydrolase family protein [Corallococcus sp. RDP092CA]|uniref:alpha/beta hydrolase family protein n=1 Tax=Corallococcus sp. RDP092CA TaxID=3109369 RepID=UPI0035AE0DEE
MRLFSTPFLALALLGAVPIACCANSSSNTNTCHLPDETPTDSGSVLVTQLDSGELNAAGQVWPYQLLKLEVPGRAATYAQWFPPRKPGVSPTVVLTRPYDGIAWTGEAVDAKWAARGAGIHPDDSEPHFGPGSSPIAFTPTTPELIAGEAFVYLFHDFGVLAVFGRFYAGGDLQNDRDDMNAGMRFLAQARNVDTQRIGIFGGSWGGYEALYAAADAPATVVPAVGVALSPLSDFAAEVDYVSRQVPARVSDPAMRSRYQQFFEPYFRRIYATTGGDPTAPGTDYARWTAAHLASAVQTPFLILHDDWDTLIPVEHTRALVTQAPQRITPMYLQNLGAVDWNTLPPDHGPLLTLHGGVVLTLSLGHLLVSLGAADQPLYVPHAQGTVRAWLQGVRAAQEQGRDVSDVVPRLLELTDPRVAMLEASLGTLQPGAAFIAQEVNAVWGTTFTEADVRSALTPGLPTP